MSILTIAQNIAMATGFSKPVTLVDNNDELAIQLLALIKEETRSISDRFYGMLLLKEGRLILSMAKKLMIYLMISRILFPIQFGIIQQEGQL